MPKQYFAWWEVKPQYLQIKFVSTLDTTTLVNENFELQKDIATPATVSDPFKEIDANKHFSSISRTLTLWWKDALGPGDYTLSVRNLKTFLGEDVGDFSFQFTCEAESATPTSELEDLLEPSRAPVEVEDYSVKAPGWSIIEPDLVDTTGPSSDSLTVVDVAPNVSGHYNVSPRENLGKIDILFSGPILSNFTTSTYFVTSKKEVKRGISRWQTIDDTLVLAGQDSRVVSVYLPAKDSDGNTVYSYNKTAEEVEDLIFFEPQMKYRLIISTDIGV